MFDAARALVAVECPRCSYPFDVQLLDAACQVRRTCPCCRVRVRLTEPDGSASVGVSAANSAVRELDSAIGDLGQRLGRTFR